MLTKRRIEVLNLMKLGYMNKGIAYELSISEGTVKTTITKILGVLGAENRAHAVYLAMKQGIIE